MSRLLGVTARDYVFRFREPSHLSEKELKARVRELQDAGPGAARGARQAAAAPRAADRGDRLPRQGDPGPGRRPPARGRGGVRRAAGDDPRPQDEAGGEGALGARAGRGAAAAAARLRDGGAEVPVRRGRHRAARASASPRASSGGFARASPTSSTARRASPSTTPTRARSAPTCSAAATRSRSRRRSRPAPGAAFVAHVAIETSYIHGRRKRSIAQEDALVFPRHFYNNYYELTKAMASLETDRALVEDGLRVTQLLPSIVIGHSRTGNNRGDTKVVNAPINAFGRAKEALDSLGGDLAGPRAGLAREPDRDHVPGRPLGRAEPRARRPRRGRHPRRARDARGDRRAHPPRDRQPHPVGGDRADHARRSWTSTCAWPTRRSPAT